MVRKTKGTMTACHSSPLALCEVEQLDRVANFLFGGMDLRESKTKFLGEFGQRDALRAASGDDRKKVVQFAIGIFRRQLGIELSRSRNCVFSTS